MIKKIYIKEEFMLKTEKEQKLKEKTKDKKLEELIELMIASLENNKEEKNKTLTNLESKKSIESVN